MTLTIDMPPTHIGYAPYDDSEVAIEVDAFFRNSDKELFKLLGEISGIALNETVERK